MNRTVLIFMAMIGASACGEPDDAGLEKDQPMVNVTIAKRDASESLSASAAAVTETAGTPTTLLFALVGPEGTRTESVDYAAHQIELPQLRRGTWRIRGDGLDAQGNVGWSTQTVVFTVAAGKRVPITLVFELVK